MFNQPGIVESSPSERVLNRLHELESRLKDLYSRLDSVANNFCGGTIEGPLKPSSGAVIPHGLFDHYSETLQRCHHELNSASEALARLEAM